MPTYVYVCPQCELEIEEIRPIHLANEPMCCPVCGTPTRRGLTAAMLLSLGKSSRSDAKGDKQAKPVHAAGCPCCAPRSVKARASAAG